MDKASYYKQILRYILRGLRMMPKALFRDDLCKDLLHKRSLGNRIIVMINANENVTGGILVKRMEKMGLKEVVHSQTPG